jgi:hypothetical protein
MAKNLPKNGAPGRTDQSPRWEGPQENTPRGFMQAKDNLDRDQDANRESNSDREVKKVSDAFRTKDD